MADITVTAARVEPTMPNSSSTIIRVYTTAEAVTAGQAAYIVAASGLVGVADANAAGKQQFCGIFLSTKGAGESVRVLQRGEVYGFTLAGNYWSLVYLSDTAGSLADAAGTMTVAAGRVVPVNDTDKTKVLYVDVPMTSAWS